jgi:hypothetical protein
VIGHTSTSTTSPAACLCPLRLAAALRHLTRQGEHCEYFFSVHSPSRETGCGNRPVVRRAQSPPYQRFTTAWGGNLFTVGQPARMADISDRLQAADTTLAPIPKHRFCSDMEESPEPKRDSSGDSNAGTSVGVHRASFAPWQAQERPLRVLRWLLLISGLGVQFPRGAPSESNIGVSSWGPSTFRNFTGFHTPLCEGTEDPDV